MGIIIDIFLFLILVFLLSLPAFILFAYLHGFDALIDEFRDYGYIERRRESSRTINQRDADNYLANSVFWSDMGNH